MLEVEAISKSYGEGRGVLQDVSFSLDPGETLSIVGPSGCGKTTLLYCICGLSAPDRGAVSLHGRPVRGPSQDIAIILQDYGLFPWKSVVDNVALGLKLRGIPRQRRRAEAGRHLAALGLAGRENDYPSCLSGGEQQRVAIARAYAMAPKLLLMDEPFSSLDAITREKLQDTLCASWREHRTPYILVTHSVEEAVVLGRGILLLAGNPATVRAGFDNPHFGDPDLRHRGEFYSLVREVRKGMEEHW